METAFGGYSHKMYSVQITRGGNYKIRIIEFLTKNHNIFTCTYKYGFKSESDAENYIKTK